MLQSKWITNLLPAFISAVLITITSTAAVALIFSGSLIQYLPIGVSCALVGAIIVNFFNGFYCFFPFAISCITPNASIAIALFLQSIAASDFSVGTKGYTVMAAFILTNVITAAVIYLWGKFRLARFIRYAPYPVLSGFYAGVGGFLILGALTVQAEKAIPWRLFFDREFIYSIFPIVIFAFVIYTVQKYYKSPKLFFIMILGFVALFYGYLYFSHIDFSQAANAGYFFKDFQLKFIFSEFMSLASFENVQFSEIFNYWYYMPMIIFINLFSLLVYAVNFEEMAQTEVDLNKESQYIGLSNMIASVFSGATTIYTMQSIVHKEAGANHRISITYVALFCFLILIFSQYIIPFIPKFVIAGLLFLSGIKLIETWLFQACRKMLLLESIIVFIIFFVMLFRGFTEGVIVGIFLVCTLFLLNYARTSVIRYGISGSYCVSNIGYSATDAAFLETVRNQIYVLRLHGYVFFGSTEKLLEYIKEVFLREDEIRYLIIDMFSVTDIDATATASILKILRFLTGRNTKLLLTSVSANIQHRLGLSFIHHEYHNTGVKFTKLSTHKSTIYLFLDLDHALQWCEKKLLRSVKKAQGIFKQESDAETTVWAEFLQTENNIRIFYNYLKVVDYKKGNYIAYRGEFATALYIVVSGRVAATLNSSTSTAKRLREYREGTVVGDMALFSNNQRQADLFCVTDCKLYQLDYEQLQKMKKEHPEIAVLFLDWLLQINISRVVHNNNELLFLKK